MNEKLNALKPCNKCGSTERYAPRELTRKLGACAVCAREKVNKHRKTWTKEKHEKVKLQLRVLQRKRTGKPIPTRQEPELCEMCSRPPGKTSLNLDHDHETGEFRGWLCSSCNRALGYLGDRITPAIQKLQKYKDLIGGEK